MTRSNIKLKKSIAKNLLCLHLEYKNEVSRYRLWNIPMRDLSILNRLIEPCFAVKASCSLMIKHTWLKNGFPD